MISMIVQCRKCEDILSIDENKWRKLKKISCPYCGEESYRNWVIIGDSKCKPKHNIDDIIKLQKEENGN